jgi:hypothetical protein
VEEALEYVEIIGAYLSAVDEVKNLKEDETIENLGHRLSLVKAIVIIEVIFSFLIHWSES